MREFWSDFRYGFTNPGEVIRAEFSHLAERLGRIRVRFGVVGRLAHMVK